MRVFRHEAQVHVWHALSRRGEAIQVRDDSDRRAKGGNGHGAAPAHRDVKPEATCWCDRRVVEVTWDEIYRGETRSCGRRGCNPPHTC